jgi:hypothetical protein
LEDQPQDQFQNREETSTIPMFTPVPQEQLVLFRSDALGRAVSHLLPYLRGAFLVGTSVSASDDVWCSYQLSNHDSDCLMLATMLPSIACRWAGALLRGELSTDIITVTSQRGDPKDPEGFRRALLASLTELNEFFERWLLVGHFVTEFDCIEPILYAHRPAGEELVDYVRPTLFTLNHMGNAYLSRYGLTNDQSIMERTHNYVADFMNLYPSMTPDTDTLLQRLLGGPV